MIDCDCSFFNHVLSLLTVAVKQAKLITYFFLHKFEGVLIFSTLQLILRKCCHKHFHVANNNNNNNGSILSPPPPPSLVSINLLRPPRARAIFLHSNVLYNNI